LIQSFDGKTYWIAIKQDNDRELKGIVSNEIISNYKEGNSILAMLPADTFVLVENAKRHLFIADGISITVLSSLIQELYKQGKSNSAKLIHCVPSESQATFANHYQVGYTRVFMWFNIIYE
ncbi:unnamed protein product, partial [Rotaria sordida]